MLDISTLIWLFPVSFMFHDFEEIVLWEPWMKRNGEDLRRRVPKAFANGLMSIAGKSAAELSVAVCLIFAVTASAALLASYGQYQLFLLTSGMYFVHGFGHLAQVGVLRRYVPGALTSALIVIPYGLVLYRRLIAGGIVDLPTILLYWLAGAVLMIPFILTMHKVGDVLYPRIVRLLVR